MRARAWTVFVVMAMAGVAAACGGGSDDEGSGSGGSDDTTTTAEGTSDSSAGTDPDLPEDGPALLAASTLPLYLEADTGNGPMSVSGGPPGTGGPTEPAVWIEHPGATGEPLDLPQPDKVNTWQTAWISPDATMTAAWVEGTAVAENSIEFERLGSDEDIPTLTYSGELSWAHWTPDSRAIVYYADGAVQIHRVGGQTAAGPETAANNQYAVASDDELTEIVFCGDPYRMTVGDGTGDGTSAQLPEPCNAIAQLSDSDGNQVIITGTVPETRAADGSRAMEVSLIRAGEDPEAVALPPTLANPPEATEGSNGYGITGCGSLAVVVSQDTAGFLDIDTGDFAVIPGSESYRWTCPIQSPDGTLAAFANTAGEVVLVDMEAGTTETVARAGTPIAFGTDNSLLVNGNGSFRIADGDAAEASVQVRDGQTINKAYCRLGFSGKVLIQTESGIQVYDVADDSSFPVPDEKLFLGDLCAATPDGEWGVSGEILIDLNGETAWVIPPIAPEDGAYFEPSAMTGTGLTKYMFSGPAQPVLSVGAR